jgi:AcrR family transcriptional regulator
VKKEGRNTRGRIISAAWELFYEQGYGNTTIEEIVEKSGTSKGSFYYYFEGKDALLGTLADLFDEKYDQLRRDLDPDLHAFEKLTLLNRELFRMIENSIAPDLLARLISTQLTTRGEKHLLDRNRLYYRLLRQIIQEGQRKGELTEEVPVPDIVKAYALCERALMYDWCLCSGEYSLANYAENMLSMFLQGYRRDPI